MGSSAGQQNKQAPGGKGAGQPMQSPGMKGGAGQPTQSPPGGKGAGQPQQAPGSKGMPSGQPTPGMKGGPANGLQPMPGQQGQTPGGKGGMSPIMAQGGSDMYHSNGGSSMQPQQPMPGGKGGMGGNLGLGTPGVPPEMQAYMKSLQGQQQSNIMGQGPGGMPPKSPNMPGGKGKGAPQSLSQAQAMQGQAPGGKGGQMDPRMMHALQEQQGMQPFHSATTNNYNAPPAARANSPYGPAGTNGNPAAFGMQPGQTGFGFGNGGARVPDTQPMIAGQQKPMQGLGQLAMQGMSGQQQAQQMMPQQTPQQAANLAATQQRLMMTGA